MSIVKSFSVQEGDTFYVRSNSKNFTIIDCCLEGENGERIRAELDAQRSDDDITRFISTHPDDDHIRGLARLHAKMDILNFYCVDNRATKPEEGEDFRCYRSLRDDPKRSFKIFKDCKRRWLNESTPERGVSGINILWPVVDNEHYQEALDVAADGGSANNISPIVRYALNGGGSAMWMGDLETEFMEAIQSSLNLPRTTILFAPHHGRDSGKVPSKLLDQIDPKIVVVGEAPSEYLHYYPDHNTITQNSAGDITFEFDDSMVHVFVSSPGYTVDFLSDEGRPDRTDAYYIGSMKA
jgi:beta-lactamase superfamily II metal-dependent hydrolase